MSIEHAQTEALRQEFAAADVVRAQLLGKLKKERIKRRALAAHLGVKIAHLETRLSEHGDDLYQWRRRAMTFESELKDARAQRDEILRQHSIKANDAARMTKVAAELRKEVDELARRIDAIIARVDNGDKVD